MSDAGAPNIFVTYKKDNMYSGVGNTWKGGAPMVSNLIFVLTKSSYTELKGTFSGTLISEIDSSVITISIGKFKTEFSH